MTHYLRPAFLAFFCWLKASKLLNGAGADLGPLGALRMKIVSHCREQTG